MPVFGPGFVVDKSPAGLPAGLPARYPRRYLLIAAVVVVAVVIVASLYARRRSPGWVYYSREGCGFCAKQDALLPPNFRAFVKVDRRGAQVGGLARPPIPTNSPLIRGYPFWYNVRTKEHKAGLQGAESLARMGIR